MATENVFGWMLPAGEAHVDAYVPTAPARGGRSVYQLRPIREVRLPRSSMHGARVTPSTC